MDIEQIKTQIETDLININSPQALEEFRLKYLSRKGLIAQLTGIIPTLALDERASFGQQVNALKQKALALVEEKEKSMGSGVYPESKPGIDISMPGIAQELGQLHPITQIIDQVCGIFNGMGFAVMEGPEIETEFNNFTGLNIPLEHPSRDAFDTFYLKETERSQSHKVTKPPVTRSLKLLLRSHTSPVQVRAMKGRKPPFAIVVPGRVYRPDAVDASHLFMFHQVEGFMVDTNITFANLKGILEVFAKEVFGKDIKMRFRPHFFPFTEPSAEVDISCIICRGHQVTRSPGHQKTCPVCHGKGWLEILGSGMIHPNVFKHVGIDSKKYTGFAFGMGIERIAMLKYGINDIRLFFENDVRFLKQF